MLHKTKAGFTLVETTLSMIFVSILLLTVAGVSLGIIKSYHQGVTIKTVNEVSHAIAEDLRSSVRRGVMQISDAPCSEDNASDFCDYANYGTLCTGEYTYVWNKAEAINDPIKQVVRLNNTNQPLRFVKVIDRGRELCGLNIEQLSDRLSTSTEIPETERAIELIKMSDNNLMMYDFSVMQGLADDLSQQAVFRISFVLGSGSGSGIIEGVRQCDPSHFDKDYCAINKFEISVLARER